MKRRDFLKFVGLASSATVLASCGVEQSTLKILPRMEPISDPDYLPGESMYRHTTCTECPVNCGATVRLVDFDPKRVDGLKGHPVNDGALCVRGQASILRLYHPDRLKAPMLRRRNALALEGRYETISWEKAYELMVAEMQKAAQSGRKNLYFSGRSTGSLAQMVDDFCAATGTERLAEYEAIAYTTEREAYNTLFGRRELPDYRIDRSDFLLTVGADIVETYVDPVAFSRRLDAAWHSESGFQWLHVEPHASLTGFKADRQLKVMPCGEAYLLLYLLNYVFENNLTKASVSAELRSALPRITKAEAATQTGLDAAELEKMGEAMAKANNPLVIAGGVSLRQKGGLQTAMLAGLLQYAMGMVGSTVDFGRALNFDTVGNLTDVAAVIEELNRDRVGVMFVAHSDPLSTLPAGMGMGDAFGKASFRVAFADVMNPTVDGCDLIIPLSTSYEIWDDAEPRKGILNIMQPVVQETIYDTRALGNILMVVSQLYNGREATGSYADFVRERWSRRVGADNLDSLVKAGYHEVAASGASVSLQRSATRSLSGMRLPSATTNAMLYILPSMRHYDGRSTELGLTTEIPDPLTTINYGKWISVPEATAGEMALDDKTLVHKDRDVLALSGNGITQKLPAKVQPGMPANVYTVHMEQVDHGLLTYDAETGECLMAVPGVTLEKTGEKKALAIMAGAMEQGHRNITRELHGHEHHHFEGDETLYPDPYERYKEKTGYRWYLTVDMETCTGCSACVAACYVENNIPMVGEEQSIVGREMSWIRVQPYYFTEDNGDVTMDSLVMMCQQCDFAPCENVCPVYATYHNDEGLNVMVYNRCVGTRYCHNNCPYKVRRFNWFDWSDKGVWDGAMARLTNPDVWVRPKGVMEKCTFCHHRIRVAADKAKDEKRRIRDGEVSTACQDACPTHAISFGNILDTESDVYRKANSNRDKLKVLEILGTSPAVTYLRKEEHA